MSKTVFFFSLLNVLQYELWSGDWRLPGVAPVDRVSAWATETTDIFERSLTPTDDSDSGGTVRRPQSRPAGKPAVQPLAVSPDEQTEQGVQEVEHNEDEQQMT